jgi:hypothetical protein
VSDDEDLLEICALCGEPIPDRSQAALICLSCDEKPNRARVTLKDIDLESLDKNQLLDECRVLRAAIRKHRDSSGHDLCWYSPELWDLLPDKIKPQPVVPPREEFLARCAEYRDSLSEEPKPLAPEAVLKKLRSDAPRSNEEVAAFLSRLRSRGDPFGVASDPDLQVAAVDAAFVFFERHPSVETLKGWIDVIVATLALGTSIERLRHHELRLVTVDERLLVDEALARARAKLLAAFGGLT